MLRHLLVCCLVVYVGVATVFGAAWWFLYFEGGPQVTFHQLVCVIIYY